MTDLPFQRFTIGQFRGLRDLVLEDCRPINLLVGGNNSGKTSVLEALVLLADPTNVDQWEAAIRLRQTWPIADFRPRGASERIDALSWLFPRRDEQISPLELASAGHATSFVAKADHIIGEPPEEPIATPSELVEAWLGPRREVESEAFAMPGLSIDIDLDWSDFQLRATEHPVDHFHMLLWERGRYRRSKRSKPPLAIAFATPMSHRSDGYLASQVGRLLRSKAKHRAVLELLYEIDSNISGLVMVSPAESELDGPMPRRLVRPMLHIEHHIAGLIPIHAVGDGTRRALHFAALLADLDRGGVLLIDELEVGLHTSALRDVFSWLGKACRDASVQVFATTHSLEAIDAILEGVPDEDLALYRLQDGEARRYAGEVLRTARVELGQEVR